MTKVEGNNGSRSVTFDLFYVIDPAYHALEFCIWNGLFVGNRNAILAKPCKLAECARAKTLI